MTLQPWKKIGLLLGIAVFVAMLLFYNPLPEQPAVGKMAAIAAFMAILWITEAIPLAATALIPLVAFPLTGIIDAGSTSKSYVNSITFLFIGGFLPGILLVNWVYLYCHGV